MKATELRVGNWVLNQEKEYQFGAKEFSDYVGFVRKKYRPIPLTEEWLSNLGLHRKYTRWGKTLEYYRHSWFIGVEKTGNVFIGVIGTTELVRLDYVHQLQNWWYANTGEELELKEAIIK